MFALDVYLERKYVDYVIILNKITLACRKNELIKEFIHTVNVEIFSITKQKHENATRPY